LPVEYCALLPYIPYMIHAESAFASLSGLALLPILILTGCGAGTLAKPSPIAIPTLHGHVMGGQQPLAGTTIQLYAVGSQGNGSGATDLLGTGTNGSATSVSSGDDGSFNITNDYSCPKAAPSAPVYLTATGGNPGLTPSVDNTSIALVAALGPCDTLLANAATTYITINEVTTAAAAWALGPFATSLTDIGATSTNLAGITQAMATANQLADPTSGLSPGSTIPSGTTMESAKLYSLANSLASCVNSNGTDGNCSNLFNDATNSGITPTDTFAAALNIVKHPSNNVSNIFQLGSSTPPFTGLPSAPSDWTVSISYCCNYGLAGAGVFLSGQMVIDADGNLWDISASDIYKLSPQGAILFHQDLDQTLPPTSNFYYYGESIAIDSQNNVWILEQYDNDVSDSTTTYLLKFNNEGQLLSPATGYTGGGLDPPNTTVDFPQSIAADSNGDIWIASSDIGEHNDGLYALAVFNESGTAISPATGEDPGSLTQTGTHTAWFPGTASGEGMIESFTAPTPTVASVPTQIFTPDPDVSFVAVDTNDNVWYGGYEVLDGSVTYGAVGEVSGGVLVADGLYDQGNFSPGGIAIDGANHIWMTNTEALPGDPSSYYYTHSTLIEFYGNGPAAALVSPLGDYAVDAGLYNASGIVADASGNLWIVNEGFLTKIVGLAVPVKIPILGPPQLP
jgi:hypothetical protein